MAWLELLAQDFKIQTFVLRFSDKTKCHIQRNKAWLIDELMIRLLHGLVKFMNLSLHYF